MIVTQGNKEEEGFTEKKNDCSIGQRAHLQEGDGYHWGIKWVQKLIFKARQCSKKKSEFWSIDCKDI